jgi:hypothetical protein
MDTTAYPSFNLPDPDLVLLLFRLATDREHGFFDRADLLSVRHQALLPPELGVVQNNDVADPDIVVAFVLDRTFLFPNQSPKAGICIDTNVFKCSPYECSRGAILCTSSA